MQRAACLLLAAAVGASALELRGAWHGAEKGAMRPEMVAETFAAVEDEWRSQAARFAECQAVPNATDCSGEAVAFQTSCGVVSKAVVAGSGGKNGVVNEYLGYVCNASALQGWKREGCLSFAQDVNAYMSADDFHNRQKLNVTSLCGHYWVKFAAQEEKRVAKEKVAEEKRLAEEKAAEEKRLAEEKGAQNEAQKKAEEEAKNAEEAKKVADEEQRKADEAHHAEQARLAAEDAKKKAEEAAESLKHKQEDAQKLADEAELAKQKAVKAAETHARFMNATKANATKAGPMKANATKSNATKTNATSSAAPTKANKTK